MAVRAITEDSQGRLWVGGPQLFSIDESGHATEFPLPQTAGEHSVSAILQTADGTLWLGMPSGLASMQHGRIEFSGSIHATVRALLQASNGALWIGTVGEGLWTYEQGRFKRVQSPGMLPSESILSLLQDHFGQIWIGTQAGLVRLEQSPLGLVSLPNVTDRGSETVTGDSAGNIWVAAHKVYMIQGQQIREVNFGLPNLNVRMLHHASDGAVWLGTENQGVFRIMRGHSTRFSAPDQLANNSVRALLESHDGRMWIATEDGVSFVENGAVTNLREKDGLAYSSTRALLEDSAGAVWIGTDHGLSVWESGHFVGNEATRTLAREKVWTIFQDRQGSLWFGTREHGLFRYSHGALLRYTTERGLPTNSIYKILQDKAGTFWISGPNIIFSLQENEMETSAAPVSPLNPVLYAIPSDGVQMYGGLEPAGYVAQDGTVWFPSNRGLAHIAAAKARSSTWAPQIWSMSDDGYQEPLHSPSPGSLSSGRVSYRLVAMYLRPQDALRFRYRIDGIDPTWTQIKPDELLTYTNLRPGRYRLRVQAIDFATTGAVSEKSVDFYKAPHLYQTWWFYVLCFVGLGLLIWVLYRYRLRQVRSRFNAVLEERARLAREMHDTVIQSCTGLSVLLEAIQNADSNVEEQRELLSYARELTSSTVNQARQAVWTVRHGPETLVDLSAEFHNISEQVRHDHDAVQVEVESADAIRLPASIAHELLMAVRESVYNALQHSGTKRVLLRSRLTEDELAIEIRDYGVGMSSKTYMNVEDGHYGIIGMQERVKRIGGEFQLTSIPGDGTQVQIRVARATAFYNAARTVEA